MVSREIVQPASIDCRVVAPSRVYVCECMCDIACTVELERSRPIYDAALSPLSQSLQNLIKPLPVVKTHHHHQQQQHHRH